MLECFTTRHRHFPQISSHLCFCTPACYQSFHLPSGFNKGHQAMKCTKTNATWVSCLHCVLSYNLVHLRQIYPNSDELWSLTVDSCGTTLLIKWPSRKTLVGVFFHEICLVWLCTHSAKSQVRILSLSLCLSHLTTLELIQEHSMLKATFTFLLAVLPSNQERAVWAQFRDLIGSCSRVGNFRKIFHFNLICSWVPCLRVVCKPSLRPYVTFCPK